MKFKFGEKVKLSNKFFGPEYWGVICDTKKTLINPRMYWVEVYTQIQNPAVEDETIDKMVKALWLHEYSLDKWVKGKPLLDMSADELDHAYEQYVEETLEETLDDDPLDDL